MWRKSRNSPCGYPIDVKRTGIIDNSWNDLINDILLGLFDHHGQYIGNMWLCSDTKLYIGVRYTFSVKSQRS